MSSHLCAVFALLLITILWGTTFPVIKELTSAMSPSWIMLLRFGIAFLLLSPFLKNFSKKEILGGAILGLFLFASYLLQAEAIDLMSANRNAFIVGLNVLIVPLLGILIGQIPTPRILVGAGLTVCGLYLIYWGNSYWSLGENLSLASAFCFALSIKMMENFSRKFPNALRLSAIQIGAITLYSGIYLAFFPKFRWFKPDVFLEHWANIAGYLFFLGIIATALALATQTWAQRHTSANEAAIVFSLEPLIAALFSFWLLGEFMTPLAIFGSSLMISGMIVSQWTPRFIKQLSSSR